MKLSCSKDLLVHGIGIVGKAVTGRSTQPILECILLETNSDGLVLTGNDLELGIESRTIAADVDEGGKVALNARIFSDIVRKMPGDKVEIECMGNFVTMLRGGGAEFRILGSDGDEFPGLPEMDGGDVNDRFEITAAEISGMIKQVLFSVSTDESKPALTGVLFESKEGKLRLVSLDTLRVSVREADIDNKELSVYAIIPGKVLGEITKVLGTSDKNIVTIQFMKNLVLFETDEARIISRLIDGKFIDYERLFATEATTYLTLHSKFLEDGLERASLISREARKNPVRLTAEERDGAFALTVESKAETGTFIEEIGQEAALSLDGQGIKISFNPKFLLDVLKVVNDGSICLKFTTPISPCIITGTEDESYRYVIMPLREYM
ncbi:MAG: DNA polymerase III subunit beta [Defluviitaleaceae bacterium]|nr:DNA polymerase III subunit beta [Defluviitaleaceae bacterium]